MNLAARGRPFLRQYFVLATSLLWVVHCQAARYFYSYGPDQGGVAIVQIDEGNGALQDHRALFNDPILSQPKKLAVSADGTALILTSEESAEAVVVQVEPTPQVVSKLKLEEPTNEVQAKGSAALLAADKGMFYAIDLKTGKIFQSWNSRENLTPPGNKGENIVFLPNSNEALVSFQKDSSKGKYFGSRLVVLDLNPLKARFDLRLPRTHTELHIPASLKEQGPNPEMIFVAPKSDTIALTLDLYGALAFVKLSDVLRGAGSDLVYESTSLDGSWGTAFPDRGCLFETGGKEYLLISNAAKDGGLILFDLATRKRLQTFPTTAGAEEPVYMPHGQKIVTCVSGKIKTRTPSGIEQATGEPQNDLLIVDVAPLATGKPATIERIGFDKPVTRVKAISPRDNALLLLVFGDTQNEIAVYDLDKRQILQREPAKGQIARIAGPTAK